MSEKHTSIRGGNRIHRRDIRGDVTRIFVAMSFRDDEEPALADYWRAMRRAATLARGTFVLTRIDAIEGDFDITVRIFKEIDSAHIVIADLTLSPANVYFELGYARGRNKYVIQTCREGTKLEFDVRGRRTLMYRNATILEENLLRHLNNFRRASLKLAYTVVHLSALRRPLERHYPYES